MSTTLTIKNYRCFVEPATIHIKRELTAFVGVNNAGKSALMRFLAEFRNFFVQLSAPQQLGEATRNRRGPIAIQYVIDQTEVFSNLNTNGIEINFHFNDELVLGATNAITDLHIIITRDLHWQCFIWQNSMQIPQDGAFSVGSPGTIDIGSKRYTIGHVTQLMSILGNTLYIGTFRNLIDVGAQQQYLDTAVGNVFINIFQEYKSGPIKQQNLAVQKIIDQIKHIFDFRDLSIESTPDRTSLHIAVNGKPYKQHELGSGLSQFIVSLINAAIRLPQIVLIDEPELGLHPQLQLDFLTSLSSYASFGVWFSTHSIGLARSAADQIYSVERRGDGNSIVRLLEGKVRPSEFLGEMSFSTHKELGFDRILLVEGPTEVKVFKLILRKMNKDHKIFLLPLHGHLPDADELHEILRISTSISAIIDSERNASDANVEPKRIAFAELCRSIGIDVHILAYRATENYFPDHVIKSVFGTNPDYS